MGTESELPAALCPREDTRRLGMVFSGGERLSAEQCRAVLAETTPPNPPPLIAAADAGLLVAEDAGVRPDWIIGDMDSLGTEAPFRLAAYDPDRVLRYPHEDKDATDTELALSLLKDKGCGRIWIVGGGGGRADHFFAVRSLFERACPPERWITSTEDMYCLDADGVSATEGVPAALSFSRAASPVSVFPLGSGPWEIESSGLRWPLAALPWSRGFFSISNEAEGPFSLTARQGRFLAVLPLDSGRAIQLLFSFT